MPKLRQAVTFWTEIEEDMLSKVCKAFDKVAVILNVGNIIDMKWVEAYRPDLQCFMHGRADRKAEKRCAGCIAG